MPESLQQKVDRMTAGMEVTVTFGGGEPGTCTGPLNQPYAGLTLTLVGRYVRFADGSPNHRITAIDMPDPECPFEIGARVRVAGHGWVYIVAGWDYYDAWKAWFVRAEVESERESHGLWRPDELTLVPPEPAEPDCPAILVTYTDGVVMVKYNDMSLDWWLTRPDVATVQALRPAEYLRGGR